MMRVLDLFSGIGGFSLGLERTGGFQTVAFCEIDPFCRRVLAKHWPKVKQYEDVRTLTARAISDDGIYIDAIVGGFPCQDISEAGKGAGIAGERSGLWKEFARIIGELRPRYVIVENVSALLSRGLGDVLGDLAALGYDAEWDCIPASAVGAPHQRDRIWIVAHPHPAERRLHAASRGRVARKQRVSQGQEGPSGFGPGREDVAFTVRDRSQGAQRAELPSIQKRQHQSVGGSSGWAVEPDVGRMAHGVPSRVDRLRSLGNAVVPQVVEVIGRAILQAERAA